MILGEKNGYELGMEKNFGFRSGIGYPLGPVPNYVQIFGKYEGEYFVNIKYKMVNMKVYAGERPVYEANRQSNTLPPMQRTRLIADDLNIFDWQTNLRPLI